MRTAQRRRGRARPEGCRARGSACSGSDKRSSVNFGIRLLQWPRDTETDAVITAVGGHVVRPAWNVSGRSPRSCSASTTSCWMRKFSCSVNLNSEKSGKLPRVAESRRSRSTPARGPVRFQHLCPWPPRPRADILASLHLLTPPGQGGQFSMSPDRWHTSRGSAVRQLGLPVPQISLAGLVNHPNSSRSSKAKAMATSWV